MEEYKVAFEFMFCFVESFFESQPDNEAVMMIYKKFFKIRKDLNNGY